MLFSIDLLCHSPVKAEFKTRVQIVRERMESKESETKGKWLTEEKMVASGDWAKYLNSQYIAFFFCLDPSRNDKGSIVTLTGYINSPPTVSMSRSSVKAIVAYCRTFPQALVRQLGRGCFCDIGGGFYKHIYKKHHPRYLSHI